MSRLRLKLLCSLLVIGVAASASMFVWGGGAVYWSSAFTKDKPQTRPTRPATRPTTRPVRTELVFGAAPGSTTKRTVAPSNAPPATAVVLDSPSMVLNGMGRRNGELLLRELPRQAVILSATHELGLAAVDRTVDFAAAAPAGAREIAISGTLAEKAKELRLTLDAGGPEPA